jgi:hypothetical protein
MQTVEEKIETLHIYVVRDEAPKPQLFRIFLSVLAFVSLVALSVAVPYQQPVTRLTLRVPAVFLPARTFTATVAIIPTGVKTFAATTAYGTLTITNGSIIGQYIPAGFTIGGVATDRAVYVPGGSATGYGWTQVSAHAGNPGTNGNIPALAINSVIGSSVYIRNLSAFSGGRDTYSVKVVTAPDKQAALLRAQGILSNKISDLHYPCSEDHSASAHKMMLTWRCQMLTYHIPAFYHVTGVRIVGKNLILSVWFVARPMHIWVK